MLLALAAFADTIPSVDYNQLRTAATTDGAVAPLNWSTFHRLGSYTVDGATWAQPLIALNVNGRDLLVVCTMHDSCYAFDANVPGSAPVWSNLAFATSRTSTPSNGGNLLYGGEVGCLATPAIDAFNQWLYAVCAAAGPSWALYRFDLRTGAILGQVTITGQVSGSGDPNATDTASGGTLSFYPAYELARAGVALANGNVYVSFGSFEDVHPYHGWLFAYKADTFAPVAAFCTTPYGYGGSIWQSGGAPAIDPQGNLYVATGNGDYDGIANFGDSVLKFSPTLALLDWYTPTNWAFLESNDLDIASGRPVLIPGAGLVTVGAKDYTVYSMPIGCLGHLGGGACGVQAFKTNPSGGSVVDGIYQGSVYANGSIYFPSVAGPIYRIALNGSQWVTTPAAIGTASYAFPGAALSISSSGELNGILWAMTAAGSAESAPQSGTIRALDPLTLAELWNSGTGADALGTLAKFSRVAIANGRLYAVTLDRKVQVYGIAAAGSGQLRGPSAARGTAVLR